MPVPRAGHRGTGARAGTARARRSHRAQTLSRRGLLDPHLDRSLGLLRGEAPHSRNEEAVEPSASAPQGTTIEFDVRVPAGGEITLVTVRQHIGTPATH